MGAAIAGGLIGGALSIGGTALSNRNAKKAARKNRRFQRDMYKNRYKYTMADMRRAGLNPILAYSQGPGSAPSGATAQTFDYGNSAGAVAKGAQAGIQAKLARAQFQNVNANTAKTHADTTLSEVTAEKVRVDTGAKRPISSAMEAVDKHLAKPAARLADQIPELVNSTMLNSAAGVKRLKQVIQSSELYQRSYKSLSEREKARKRKMDRLLRRTK